MRSLFIVLAALITGPASAASLSATLYRDPYCGCCLGYAKALHEAGFKVKVVNTPDMSTVKAERKIPTELQSCHTAVIDSGAGRNYVVEGHVPISAVRRLLNEKPEIRGIGMPGMPIGTPGMPGEKTAPFTVYELDVPDKIYAVE